MEKEVILSAKNLSKIYKTFSLKDVSFDIYEGDIVGFVGENGAGKSTTLKALMSLINLNDGEVTIFGKHYDELTELESQEIAFVPDEICLPSKLSLIEINNIFKYTFEKWNSDTYFSYLEKFNLPKKSKVKKLSKGMKAKLNLAVAFSHEARFLILDEPMNGLDPVTRYEVMEILNDFMKEPHRAIIISSHIISDLEKLCNRILLIHDGKIVIDEAKEILDQSFDVVEDLTKDQYEQIDKDLIIRYMVALDKYSILVKKDSDLDNERKATLEDIIVFMIKGNVL